MQLRVRDGDERVAVVRVERRGTSSPLVFGTGGSAKAVGPLAILRNGVLLAYAVLATASPSGAAFVPSVAALVHLGAILVGAVALS